MSMRTKPDRNLPEQNIVKNGSTSRLRCDSLAVAVRLLAGFLICAASGSAQTNQRTTATLRLSVYVIPVVSAVRNDDRNLSGPSPGNANSVINLSTLRWEPVEDLRPLITSPWAGIVSEPQGEHPTLAQPKGSDGQASSDHFPQTSSEPSGAVPPNGEIILHSFTYVAK
jgi:hypothetical protein